jgi:hypothetical protein
MLNHFNHPDLQGHLATIVLKFVHNEPMTKDILELSKLGIEVSFEPGHINVFEMKPFIRVVVKQTVYRRYFSDSLIQKHPSCKERNGPRN